ncbi:catecholate siderophore receptor [Geopseudomonas sagittaria]|uniref:Catecholate siderophore receptor n=1 Tax=Geopseudomonas sagittaria TaxID=1135990 RepID=A0A1I5UWT6_9GAMM|nr:TonB-dependent siderophore receptor [Pseudomonas sagittaria]SFP99690.1 catecholate siderophore receptor [Pseudomonas sagittaria]
MRAFIKASTRQPQRLLATAVGLAVASLAVPALAEEQGALQLDNVSVQGEQDSGYKTESVSSPKYTAPLLDTPQTISVVPQQVIQEQQALSLRQVLSNVSGITFNAGEGGGGSGDSINIRGFSANANMQIDGLRDSSQTNRTDTFNIEAVEVIKGPNSVFGGSGTTGGSINQVSKEPRQRDFTQIGASLGTDNYKRMTLDTNQTLEGVGTDSAFRLNLMAHENDVPGRDEIDRERWGIAPSLALGLSDATRLTLSYFHQTDDNLPDYGVPARDGKKLAGVDREAYFGWKNLDKDEVESDAFTVKLEHEFNDSLSLQNLTRYSRIDRDAVVSASHVNTTGVSAGRYKPAGPQAYGRDVTTDMWINQTNLSAYFDTLGLGHTLVTGAEISREDYERITYNHGLASALYPADGYALANPPGYWSGPVNKTRSADTSTVLDSKALYVFDTIALDPRWDLSLGLRYDWLDGEYRNTALPAGTVTDLETSDEKLSGRAGLVFKPADNGRIYVAYGTSFNPSAEFLATSGAGVSAATADLSPEKNETWELGTKWELLGGRLQLDGALFRVEKTDAREELADGSFVLAGEQRVQGVELGVTGKVSEQWNVYANYTFLDSETLKSVNDPSREGQALGNTPPRSFNLWTTYELPAGWTLGYGARYVSERNVTATDSAKLDAYWLHNAMVGYQVSKNLDLQLNVNNLFDEDYVERVRQNPGTDARSSAIEYGDARAAILSANYSF